MSSILAPIFLAYAGGVLAETAGCFTFRASLRLGKSPLWAPSA